VEHDNAREAGPSGGLRQAFPDSDVTWKRNSTTSPVPYERPPPNNLVARIVTVSLETMAIVDALPTLEILPTQVKT